MSREEIPESSGGRSAADSQPVRRRSESRQCRSPVAPEPLGSRCEAARELSRIAPMPIPAPPQPFWMGSAAPPRPSEADPEPIQGRSGGRSPPSRAHPSVIRCSNTRRVTAVLHRFGDFLPSTSWGLGKLSRSCPQAPRVRDHQTRSSACGFVDKRYPQPVDGSLIPSLWIKLSTDNPQAGAGCPQRSPASPHRCPLFGNATRHLTVSSERRHTKVPGWAVGKVGKAGDGAGEKWPSAVHGVCRTFCSPQKPEVVHRRHPQGRWTKFPP